MFSTRYLFSTIKQNILKCSGKAWKQWDWSNSEVSKSERSPLLKTGVTPTIFESTEKIPFSSDESNINLKGPNSLPKRVLTTLKLVLSYPEHLSRCSLPTRIFLWNSHVLCVMEIKINHIENSLLLKKMVNIISKAIYLVLSFKNRIGNRYSWI